MANHRNKRNLRLPNKPPMAPIAMAATGVTVNGCQVFLGHPNGQKAGSEARKFKAQFGRVLYRSRVPNITDMYHAHFQMCKGLESGKSIKEIIE